MIKSWLDIAPAYIDFVIKFCRNPYEAVKPIAQPGKVSSDLAALLLGGVGLSYALVLMADSERLRNDQSPIARLAADLAGRELLLLPLAALLIILLGAVIWHLLAKAFAWVASFGGRVPDGFVSLAGGMEDSVNAAVGLASVFLPLIVGTIGLVTRLPDRYALGFGSTASAVIAVGILVCYPLALSATHPRTSAMQAFFALCGGAAPVVLLIQRFAS